MAYQLPPSSSDGVFAVSGSAIIDASIETVWNNLLDFKGYKEWNPFVRDQNITDSSGNILPDQTIAEGKFVHIYPVHLTPSLEDVPFYNRFSAFVVCTALDHENHRVAWKTTLPRWLLDAERWQSCTVVPGGKVKYESIEVFNGILAYLVRFFVGQKLINGVGAMARGLQAKSEN
ncbi:uncharacterized protein BT62DRAFT_948474 [Guyanagaster necrorhizus]|uniref:Uncharacterized protein n=1 Tax=Guyanagaster necrorhizus TaxID=856835 RepID=A0A9P7VVD7_9AGAR|nr:uncharacterized protein BT62DRAFT_948474 [Guyanagaster necrorhizus MCA 3950]KAG7447400.1 hypothetical protein BT62DRAFT_948474 [Guyanagaster necrorhizus MCA 3950]